MDQDTEPWWQHVLESTQSWQRAQAESSESSSGTLPDPSSEAQPADSIEPDSRLSVPYILETPNDRGVETAYPQAGLREYNNILEPPNDGGVEAAYHQAGPIQNNMIGMKWFAPNQSNTSQAGPIEHSTTGTGGFAPSQSNTNQADQAEDNQIILDVQDLWETMPANLKADWTRLAEMSHYNNTRDPVPPERWEMLWRDLKCKEPRLAKEMLASNLKLHGANVKSISVDK
ncbi:MAG: hypothetical protein Q9203_004380, partial [Teloschistes exilis]